MGFIVKGATVINFMKSSPCILLHLRNVNTDKISIQIIRGKKKKRRMLVMLTAVLSLNLRTQTRINYFDTCVLCQSSPR